jgi:hypothetical protein
VFAFHAGEQVPPPVELGLGLGLVDGLCEGDVLGLGEVDGEEVGLVVGLALGLGVVHELGAVPRLLAMSLNSTGFDGSRSYRLNIMTPPMPWQCM